MRESFFRVPRSAFRVRKSDYTFYVKELRGDECQCGRSKKRGFAFCRFCWFELPFDLQQRLYLPLFGGYEEAYEEAVGILTEEGHEPLHPELEDRPGL